MSDISVVSAQNGENNGDKCAQNPSVSGRMVRIVSRTVTFRSSV